MFAHFNADLYKTSNCMACPLNIRYLLIDPMKSKNSTNFDDYINYNVSCKL